MNTFFPINEAVKPKNIVTLIIAIVLYIVISGIAGTIVDFLGWIPIVGWAISIAGGIVGLYCLIGIIAAIGKYIR